MTFGLVLVRRDKDNLVLNSRLSDTMAVLTEKPQELLIYIRDIYGAEQISRYTSVTIGPKVENYVIQIGEKIDGDIEEDWTMISGQQFGNFDHNRPLECIDPLAYGW